MMSRTAEIKLTVDLDAENLPTRIEWQATDADKPGPKFCQSMMLSLWDAESKTTAAIDLSKAGEIVPRPGPGPSRR